MMPQIVRNRFVLIYFLFLAPTLFSQTEWTSLNGPEGGKITAIQLDPGNPNVILIGTDGGGVFQSFDGGNDWHPKNQGLTNFHVRSLVFTYSDPKILFCGTDHGLFKSNDFGESWVPSVFDSLQIHAIKFHPAKPGFIFLATNRGIFRSVDFGENWDRLATNIPAQQFFSILIHAADDHTLLVGTDDGVYISPDLGGSWNSTGLQGETVQTLSMHSGSARTMYAGTRSGGIFRNLTGGKNWEPLTDGINAKDVRQVLNDPLASGTLYAISADAGIFKSMNRGSNWTALKNGLPSSRGVVLSLNPTNNQEIWAGLEDGVFYSKDGGLQWQWSARGILASKINALAFNPKNVTSIFAGTQNQIIQSRDRGKTWSATTAGFPNFEITSLAVSPADTNVIWAGTAQNGVLLSTDAGQTWRQTSDAFTVSRIVPNPGDRRMTYLLTNRGILKTSDLGVNWAEKEVGLPEATVHSLILNSQNPLELFAGISGHGVYKSANGGERWFAYHSGIENLTVFSLLQIDPSGPALLAGTNAGLFESKDQNGNWNALGSIPDPIMLMASRPSNPGLIYAITADHAIVLSPDFGETWQKISEADEVEALCLAMNPVSSGRALVGSYGKGVFQYQSHFPFIAVTVSEINFGDVPVDSSKIFNFELKNVGSTELQIENISIDADQFTVVLDQKRLPPNGTVTVKISFFPDAAKIFPATLKIQSNDPARSDLRLPVQGRGIAPELAVSTDSIYFGPVRKNQQRQHPFFVSNPGTAPLVVHGLEIESGPFSVAKTGFTLNPAASREITLTFTPPDTGIFQGTLLIRSSVRDQIVRINGYGVMPKMEVSAAKIDFGETIIQQPVRRQLEISNPGNTTLVFNRVTFSQRDFFRLANVPDSLDAYSKTTLEIIFQPVLPGLFTDSLTIETNGGDSLIELAGIGNLPPFRLSADSLDFTRQRVGRIRALPDIYLKNQSPLAVKLRQVQVKMQNIFPVQFGDSIIAAQDSLKISVQFQPEIAKIYSDTLSITSDFWHARVGLRGEGISPVIQLSRQEISFPRVRVGQILEQALVLSNSGNDTLHIFKTSTRRPEFQVNTDLSSLAPGAQQEITIKFEPSAGLVLQDTLKILTDLTEIRVPLQGSGELVRLVLSRSGVDFGSRLINSSSFEQLLVYNQGSHDLIIHSLALKNGGAFDIAPSQAVIRPGDSLKAIISFRPQAAGTYSDSLLCLYSENEMRTLPISGAGIIPATGPRLVIEPDTLHFSRTKIPQKVGQLVRITNLGSSELILTPPHSSESAFTFSAFPAKLDSGKFSQVWVWFTPTARKFYQDEVFIASNANTDSLFLAGEGVAPELSVSDSIIAFANTPVDSFRQATFLIKNTGNDTLKLTSITALPGEFQVAPARGWLLAGDSLVIQLDFNPHSIGVFKGLLTIVGNDPFRRKSEIQITGAAFGPDRTAPVILHAPNLTAPANQPITLTAQISDENSGVARALVYFRSGGSAAFESPLDISAGTTQIPATFVTTRGVEYFLRATDHAGHETRTPKTSSFYVSVIAGAPGEFQRDERNQALALPFGSAQTAYHLLSIPLILDQPHPQDVLSDALGAYDEQRWVFADYNPQNGDADGFVYLTEPKKIADFTPGKAFWILNTEPNVVIHGRGRSVNSTENFRLPLAVGWNLVGNPFVFPIKTEQLYLASGNPVTLFTYQSRWDTASVLAPWEGYAICNLSASPDTLVICPQGEALPGLAKNPPAEFDWRLRLIATCDSARDELNWVGVSSLAADTWDRLDQPEPPGIGAFVSLWFPHPEWELPISAFTSDFQPVQSHGYSWTFEVRTNIKNAKVTINLAGLAELPDGYQAVLRDRETGVVHEISEGNGYEYPVFDAEASRHFELQVGSPEWLAANTEFLPKAFDLSPAFPNPARSVTVIRYSLPQATEVSLTIFNVTGQQIQSLLVNQPHSAGHHLLLWDGRNAWGQPVANGVYFYQLQTAGFRQSHKVLILH